MESGWIVESLIDTDDLKKGKRYGVLDSDFSLKDNLTYYTVMGERGEKVTVDANASFKLHMIID